MKFLINTSVVVFPFPNEEQILDLILIYGPSQRDHGFVPAWFEHDVFLPSDGLTSGTRLSSSSRSNTLPTRGIRMMMGPTIMVDPVQLHFERRDSIHRSTESTKGLGAPEIAGSREV